MSRTHSTDAVRHAKAQSSLVSTGVTKPSKPYADFPLFPHATGRWAKKIRGRMVYFGPWADPQAALDIYLSQKDDLHAGRRPRASEGTGNTIRDLCNQYWNAKKALLDNDELSPRTFIDVESTATQVAAYATYSRRSGCPHELYFPATMQDQWHIVAASDFNLKSPAPNRSLTFSPTYTTISHSG